MGLWWRRRRRRHKTDDKAFRLGRAQATAELALLAAAIARLGKSSDERAAHRHAQAAERYTTAVDLIEQARTASELETAGEVIAEGRALAGDAVGVRQPRATR